MLKKYYQKLDCLLKKEGIVLAYLFGSEARGTSHKESDVDIGILFDKKICSKNYLEKEGMLIGFFSKFFPKKEINIVNLNVSSPLLKQVVVLEGNLLYQRNSVDKILFQIRTLREYEDYLYLNKVYNQF